MNNYDFFLGGEGKKNKQFAEKMQNERKQRLENKKIRASALKIFYFYKQSQLYHEVSQNLSQNFAARLTDLLKMETMVKEKFPYVIIAAAEKFQLFRGIMLLTKYNGEKFVQMIENFIHLFIVLNGSALKTRLKEMKFIVYIKRLSIAIFGILIRNKIKFLSHQVYEFLKMFVMNENVYEDIKFMVGLIDLAANDEFLAKIVKELVEKVLVRGKQKNKEIILLEIIQKTQGVNLFLPENSSIYLENLISMTPNLMKKVTKEKINTIGIYFENFVTTFSKIEKNKLDQYLLFFFRVFNDLLDRLIPVNNEKDKNDQINLIIEEEKGEMEIEYQESSNETIEIKQETLEIFFSNDFITFILNTIKNELQNKSVFNSQDWDLLRNISHLYSNFIQRKSQNKIEYLILLSMKTSFVELLFGVFELFNFKIFNNQIDVFADIINLFTRLYYQKIILMDEMEFYSLDLPIVKTASFLVNFPMEKILILSKFLNNFVYQNFFLEQQKLFIKCKHSAIKLLKELHDRHTIRPFTSDKSFWLISNAILLNNPVLYTEIPFVLPFEVRVDKFNRFLEEDQYNVDREDFGDLQVIAIRRGFEIEDGLDKFLKIKDLRNLIRIKYVNEHGIEEIGIDGGGILKDYLTVVCKKAFDPNYGLFIETEEKTLWPNPHIENVHYNYKDLYLFLGKIIGKAAYENILIEPVFSRSFLNNLLRRKNQFNDLASLDKSLYKSLLFLKHTEDENVIQSLGLNFSINEKWMDHQTLVELKPNGASIDVVKNNRLEFIQLLCDYKLNKQIQKQVQFFMEGFESIIQVNWLQMFSQDELQILISGSKGFDVADLRNNCDLKGFSPNDLTIQFLWVILETFTPEEQQLFLFFATSCSRPPLLGFKSLHPPFSIQKADYGGVYFGQDELDRLPTSSTCMNILRLPDYKDFAKLKEKLTYAIKSKSGFDLS